MLCGLTMVEEASVTTDEAHLIQALRAGDETAFRLLLDRYQSAMLRLVLMYVPNRAVAEEVIQETWIAVLKGIERFEGRSSLKTWVFGILMNRARTIARFEGRYIPFGALELEDESEVSEKAEFVASVNSDRFHPADHPSQAHHWSSPPQSWNNIPEDRFLAQETHRFIQQAIDVLPPRQREVIVLHDIEGWTSEEICDLLGVSEANQRVLLHRARARVREALEQYLAE